MRFAILYILFIFLPLVSIAQPKYKGISTDLKSGGKQSFQFDFPNIGKVKKFYDPKLLAEIRRLDEANELKQLLPLLEKYVSQFGIDNFLDDQDLMWRLAQLYEANHQEAAARFFFGLLIRNTDRKLDTTVKVYYDNLNKKEADLYVPLKYYYELVDYRKHVDTLRPPRGVFISMGYAVNTDREEYGPSISDDNQVMLFCAKRDLLGYANNKPVYNEDLYITIKDEQGEWGEAVKLQGLNSQFSEGSPCLSRDGKFLFFIRCNSPEGLGECDLFVAEREDDTTYVRPKNLGPAVNSRYWDSQPALSSTEDTLFFVSNRPGGFGGTDIYFSVKNKKTGTWSAAQNLGPMINTKADEMSPFFHPNFDILYFSSSGEIVNFGGFDIYKSNIKNGKWGEPKNIGPLVNGVGDEHYFTIDAESKKLFYAKTDEENPTNLDLYSFPLPMEAQPMATTSFSGTLKDSVTGEVYKGIVSVIDLETGIEVAPKFVREDGTFSFDLIDNQKYLLIIQGEDFFRIEKEIKLNGDTAFQVQAQGIKSYRIQFSSIEFATNSHEILPEMEADLQKLLDYMLDNPTASLVISGHTDSKGNAEKNRKLSQLRADAIKNYLVETGDIDSSRITAIGYGSTKPIKKEEVTDEDRKLNRRVEFEIRRPADGKVVDPTKTEVEPPKGEAIKDEK